ncbi:MAG: lysine--tRNA ligase [Spirochaetaceae bacterium]|nr:lysine--tRNA ligase [Spirochaetaceae bacterium]
MEQKRAIHWADQTAEKIIQTWGEKELYTCASGITPSGTVHVGNFREMISVELVVRALRDMGKKVRFIYSWDDYDVFRKVPLNMPNQELLAQYLRFPITMVPDPWGRDESYARHHEVDVEQVLPEVGIYPEFIYQAKRYRAGVYAEGMRRALQMREHLKSILDKYRDEDHKIQGEWWPVAVFCSNCNRDTTEIDGWDGDWGLTYHCESCGHQETGDLRTLKGAKLVWRVDWPMRWAYEQVDFEPAGKDHHSQGGSFDTSKHVVEEVYNRKPPVTFRYDFIGIKGSPGKMSSSKGKVVDLPDLLRVYQPEIVRYLFAGTRPNTEFVISFDLDVIKIYEDYDRTERIYWGLEKAKNPEAEALERRIYELSQVEKVPEEMPYQIPFRHLCNLLQIHLGNIDKVLSLLPDLKPSQVARVRRRAECAWYWITECASEEFRFFLREPGELAELSDLEREAVRRLRDDVVSRLDTFASDAEVAEAVYAAAQSAGCDAKMLFRAAYQALIGKDQGPRLAGFLRAIGREKIESLLSAY